MSILISVFIFLLVTIFLSYFRSSLIISTFVSITYLGIYILLGIPSVIFLIILTIVTTVLAFLSKDSFRQNWISAPFFNLYKKALPSVSETEQIALDAGTVWWEGEIFKGNPNWQYLLSVDNVSLTEEEKAFLDGPVESLCRMVNTWEINYKYADIPDEVIDFIKKNKFLGLIIPKKYGGIELSPVAQVAVFTKIFSRGGVVGNFISVPNSLGPGELLVRYGTEEQKKYYLPRLASGEELPCFALTGPLAGSDATSIPDTGVICKGKWQGKRITGIRLNINKRYITLAPVASLVGLAFKLSDPEHLIGEKDYYGITCALVPRETDGLEIGRRHLPIGEPFLNGPIRGKDIFIPLDFIIGGKKMVGQGWQMLIECLSTGRAISLPTISNSIAKNALATTSAYSRIRRQFGLSIAEFEGVKKPLTRMAGLSYIIHAATLQTAGAIGGGARPAVPASILKYHCTEMARKIINDAMDIQAGKAVMKGPKNMLSAAYESIPVAITVEGANIMTRSLMIFGQGAIRCHPYVLKEMELTNSKDLDVIKKFDGLLFAHIGNTIRNSAHAFVSALTGSIFNCGNVRISTKRYCQHVTRLSAAFSLVSDVAMLTMQSSLKKREMISARLGDLLSTLYLVSMVIKQYEDQGAPEQLRPIIDWSCQYLLNQYQESMMEFLDNLPNKIIARFLKFIVFPLGGFFKMPSDRLDIKIASLITFDTNVRTWLIEGIDLTPSENNQLGVLNELLSLACELDPILKELRKLVKQGELPNLIGIRLINKAEEGKFVTKEEAKKLREFDKKMMEIINVDDFDYADFSRSTI